MDVSSFFEEKIFVESSIFTSAFSGAKNQGTNFEFLYIERAEKIIEKFNQEIINERVSNLYDLYDLFEGKNKNFSIYEIKMFSEDFIDVIKKIKSEGTKNIDTEVFQNFLKEFDKFLESFLATKIFEMLKKIVFPDKKNDTIAEEEKNYYFDIKNISSQKIDTHADFILYLYNSKKEEIFSILISLKTKFVDNEIINLIQKSNDFTTGYFKDFKIEELTNFISTVCQQALNNEDIKNEIEKVFSLTFGNTFKNNFFNLLEKKSSLPEKILIIKSLILNNKKEILSILNTITKEGVNISENFLKTLIFYDTKKVNLSKDEKTREYILKIFKETNEEEKEETKEDVYNFFLKLFWKTFFITYKVKKNEEKKEVKEEIINYVQKNFAQKGSYNLLNKLYYFALRSPTLFFLDNKKFKNYFSENFQEKFCEIMNQETPKEKFLSLLFNKSFKVETQKNLEMNVINFLIGIKENQLMFEISESFVLILKNFLKFKSIISETNVLNFAYFLPKDTIEKTINKISDAKIKENLNNFYNSIKKSGGLNVVFLSLRKGTTKTEPVKATVRVNPYSLLFFVLINKFSYLKQNAQNISQSQNIENAVDILTKISEKLI